MKKMIAETEQLVANLATAARAVANVSTIEEMKLVLLHADAENQEATISGYNLKVGIRTCFHADVMESFSVCVPPRLLLGSLNLATNDFVTIEIPEEGRAVITCGDTKLELPTLPADGFPELPAMDNAEHIALDKKVFQELIEGTAFNVGVDETKPATQGIRLTFEGGEISASACDGYRFAVRTASVTDPEVKKLHGLDFIVAGDATKEMVAAIKKSKEKDIQLQATANHMSLKVGTTTIVARRLQGAFLDWKEKIQLDNPYMLEIERSTILDAVRRCNLLTTVKDMKYPVRFEFGKNTVKLSVKSSLGRTEDVCNALTVDAALRGMVIGFNANYLQDALMHTHGDVLKFGFKSPIAPLIITSGDDENEDNKTGFIYMVLPVRMHN